MSIKSSEPVVWLYFVVCVHNFLYVGVAADPVARFELHRRGSGARSLRIKRPVYLLGALPCSSRSAALALERKIKRWPSVRKWGCALEASQSDAWRGFAEPRGWTHSHPNLQLRADYE